MKFKIFLIILFLGCTIIGFYFKYSLNLSNSLFSKLIYYSKPPKIAILYIATGQYITFWDKFYEAMEKNFLSDYPKTYFIWTDSQRQDFAHNVKIIHQEKLGWPYDTLFRFKMFNEQEKNLKSYDYIFFLNTNMKPVQTIGAEILPSVQQGLTVMQHPGYYKNSNFPYERNKASTAYIPSNQDKKYIMGAFNGGRKKPFLELIKTLHKNIQEDEKNHIMAIWHDESHLNRYILDKKPLILDPRYGFPEVGALEMNPNLQEFIPYIKMIVLEKTNYGGHKYLREK